jgi:hypothetical protein
VSRNSECGRTLMNFMRTSVSVVSCPGFHDSTGSHDLEC